VIGIDSDFFKVVVLAGNADALLAVIPALVNSRVSSPIGTTGALGTN
jgi:hypothetical protein